jgi:hypothetical protein
LNFFSSDHVPYWFNVVIVAFVQFSINKKHLGKAQHKKRQLLVVLKYFMHSTWFACTLTIFSSVLAPFWFDAQESLNFAFV